LSLLGRNIFLSILPSSSLSLCLYLIVKGQVSNYRIAYLCMSLNCLNWVAGWCLKPLFRKLYKIYSSELTNKQTNELTN
jgi:hypothetical protein